MRFPLAIVLAIALHLLLGWAWTLLAAAVLGYLVVRKGWLHGAAALAVSWGLLVLYSYMAAPYETSTMLHTFGALMGGMPGWTVVAATLLIGVVLGALGGMIGTLGARLHEEVRQRRAAEPDSGRKVYVIGTAVSQVRDANTEQETDPA